MTIFSNCFTRFSNSLIYHKTFLKRKNTHSVYSVVLEVCLGNISKRFETYTPPLECLWGYYS